MKFAYHQSSLAFLYYCITLLLVLITTSFAMTSKDSWIDGIQMEPYTPPGEDESSPMIETNASLQIPAGIVWKDDKDQEHSLNLSTCVYLNTAETTLQWKALQKSDVLMKKLSKQDSQHGSLPIGTCQIHLGGTAIHLDLIAPLQVVEHDDDDDKSCELVLGSDFIKHYNIQVDLPNHQLVVPEGESCVTIPFIQPRGEIVEKTDE